MPRSSGRELAMTRRVPDVNHLQTLAIPLPTIIQAHRGDARRKNIRNRKKILREPENNIDRVAPKVGWRLGRCRKSNHYRHLCSVTSSEKVLIFDFSPNVVCFEPLNVQRTKKYKTKMDSRGWGMLMGFNLWSYVEELVSESRKRMFEQTRGMKINECRRTREAQSVLQTWNITGERNAPYQAMHHGWWSFH